MEGCDEANVIFVRSHDVPVWNLCPSFYLSVYPVRLSVTMASTEEIKP